MNLFSYQNGMLLFGNGFKILIANMDIVQIKINEQMIQLSVSYFSQNTWNFILTQGIKQKLEIEILGAFYFQCKQRKR